MAIPYAGRGKRPQFCIAHAVTNNRARRVKNLIKQENPNAQEALDAYRASLTGDAANIDELMRAHAPEALAVGFMCTSDPREAARRMNLKGLTDEQLEQAAHEARTRWKDLTERKSAALGEQIQQAMAGIVVRLKATIPSMPATQAANAMKALAQCLELVQGSTAPAYTELKLVIPDPNDPVLPLQAKEKGK